MEREVAYGLDAVGSQAAHVAEMCGCLHRDALLGVARECRPRAPQVLAVGAGGDEERMAVLDALVEDGRNRDACALIQVRKAGGLAAWRERRLEFHNGIGH